MREIYWETQFKKDYKKVVKQGKDLDKLKKLLLCWQKENLSQINIKIIPFMET